jgi:hypothetical protein
VFAVLKSLIENHKPFITLSGDKNLRLEKAIAMSMICQRLNWGYRRSILSKFTYGIPFENVCGQLNKFKRGFQNDAGRARKGL